MSHQARAMARQALRDLDHARNSAAGGFHEWSGVSAQQAAEKAIKALLLGAGLTPDRTRDLVGLARALCDAGGLTDAEWTENRDAWKRLTRAFLLGRYPMEGGPAPHDLFGEEDSAEMTAIAERTIRIAQTKAPELFE